LSFRRKQEQIAAESALDGIYVLRTSIPAETLDAPDVVRAYKQLKEVERGFHTLKGPRELRPIHHHLEDRLRAHVFLCTLSYYLSRHLRRAWKRCSSTTSSRPSAPTPSPRPPAHALPSARRRPSAPPTEARALALVDSYTSTE
jgi:transposase